MFSREYWAEVAASLLQYAGSNPGEFLVYVLLILSPFFALSAYLSWRLSQAIEKEKTDKRRKQKMQSNVARARHRKAD